MVVVKFFGCGVALATIAGRRPDVATAGAHQRFPLAGISDESRPFAASEAVRSADAARHMPLMRRISLPLTPDPCRARLARSGPRPTDRHSSG